MVQVKTLYRLFFAFVVIWQLHSLSKFHLANYFTADFPNNTIPFTAQQQQPHEDGRQQYISSPAPPSAISIADFIHTHTDTHEHTHTHNDSIPTYMQTQTQRSEKACEKDTSMLVLEEWKQNHQRLACDRKTPPPPPTTTTSNVADYSHSLELVVDNYVLNRWELGPTIFRYKNVEALSISGPPLFDFNKLGCRPINNNETTTTTSSAAAAAAAAAATAVSPEEALDDATVNNIIDVDATVIRIVPFAFWNPYERFHAYINVAMIMIMFDIRDPQLVLISNSYNSVKSDTNDVVAPPEGDKDMWRIFSKLEPIFVTLNEHNIGVDEEHERERQLFETTTTRTTTTTTTTTPIAAAATAGVTTPTSSSSSSSSSVRYRFHDIIEAPRSGLSMTNTKSSIGFDTSLKGRGIDHHCKSLIFQGIIGWIKSNFNIQEEQRIKEEERRNAPTQIVWSSRRSYCCRTSVSASASRTPGMYTPMRIIANETQFIEAIGNILGSGYNITAVDFGSLSTFESLQLAARSDIMVGVHGAGLIWSAFLPQHTQRQQNTTTSPPTRSSSSSNSAGLVEIFGGDRSPVNRHYHNIASLVDIEYRQTKFWKESQKLLRWDNDRVNEMVNLIRSIR